MIKSGLFENIRKSGKDPLNYVHLTANSILQDDDTYSPAKLVDNSEFTHYHSKSGTSEWVYFNFYAKPLRIKGFSITLINNRDPLHWKLEGTNNGSIFTDVYDNDGIGICDLNDDGFCTAVKTKQFILSHSVTFSGYRLKMTGSSSRPGDDFLVLSNVDFYGNFVYNQVTCFCKRSNVAFGLYLFIFVIS